MAGILVDPPEVNAAMVRKLELPFPLLSDPGGDGAIKPYGVWNAEAQIAFPAVIVVDPRGEEAFRQVSRDFADRLEEDRVVDVARSLHLTPVTQERPAPAGPGRPSERAVPREALAPYFRGVRYSAVALGSRVDAARDEAQRLQDEAARYIEAAQALG